MSKTKERVLYITRTAMFIAIVVVSQLFKNINQFITGPIVNLVIIIALLSTGLVSAITVSVFAPITSFLITGSPILKAAPYIMFFIMIGNIFFALSTYLFTKKIKDNEIMLAVGLVVGALVKSGFMYLFISTLILGNVDLGLPAKAIEMAKISFGINQLYIGLIGAALSFIIWNIIKFAVKRINAPKSKEEVQE